MRLKKKNNSVYNNSIKIILRALTFIALFVFITDSLLYSQILKNIESDFLKIDSDIIYQSDKIDSLIYFVDKNSVDNILINIYSNGEAEYNSNLIFSNNDSISFDDHIQVFLDKFDSLDVKIHAWFNIYNLWSENFYPENNNHFYYQCPECLESDINGRSDENINLDQIQSMEWEGVFLSPLHPLVNNYVISIVDEVVKKYEFDGVFLDYLRYQDYYYGYNIEGIDEFENLHGINPQDIHRGIVSRNFGYNKSKTDSIKLVWDQFKSNKITELLVAINNSYLYNNIEIGISAVSDPQESKERWYQDWGLWLDNDIVDYIVVDYSEFYDFNNFNYLMKKISRQINYKNKEKIYFEMSTSDISLYDISNKIISMRLNGYENLGINYDFMKDTLDWYIPLYETINFKIK